MAIARIEPGTGVHEVYNLSVAEAHTYFVGETEIWVHNVKDDGGSGDEGDDGGGIPAVKGVVAARPLNPVVKGPGNPKG